MPGHPPAPRNGGIPHACSTSGAAATGADHRQPRSEATAPGRPWSVRRYGSLLCPVDDSLDLPGGRRHDRTPRFGDGHNAIRAAAKLRPWHETERPIEIAVTVTGRYTLLSVRDPGIGLPIRREATGEDEEGRGVAIVESLVADTWPVPGDHCKTIHALIAHPGVRLTRREITDVSAGGPVSDTTGSERPAARPFDCAERAVMTNSGTAAWWPPEEPKTDSAS
jgi:hypothetical protein